MHANQPIISWYNLFDRFWLNAEFLEAWQHSARDNAVQALLRIAVLGRAPLEVDRLTAFAREPISDSGDVDGGLGERKGPAPAASQRETDRRVPV